MLALIKVFSVHTSLCSALISSYIVFVVGKILLSLYHCLTETKIDLCQEGPYY